MFLCMPTGGDITRSTCPIYPPVAPRRVMPSGVPLIQITSPADNGKASSDGVSHTGGGINDAERCCIDKLAEFLFLSLSWGLVFKGGAGAKLVTCGAKVGRGAGRRPGAKLLVLASCGAELRRLAGCTWYITKFSLTNQCVSGFATLELESICS